MALDNAQVSEAIEQMKSHTRASVEGKDYEFMSARGVLYTLGYEEDDADQVIKHIASKGFDYCLDPMVKCTPGMGEPYYPSADACHWGADQLLSRLQFIS